MSRATGMRGTPSWLPDPQEGDLSEGTAAPDAVDGWLEPARNLMVEILRIGTFETTSTFDQSYRSLTPDERRRFRRVVLERFVPDLRAGRIRAGLRVKSYRRNSVFGK